MAVSQLYPFYLLRDMDVGVVVVVQAMQSKKAELQPGVYVKAHGDMRQFQGKVRGRTASSCFDPTHLLFHNFHNSSHLFLPSPLHTQWCLWPLAWQDESSPLTHPPTRTGPMGCVCYC